MSTTTEKQATGYVMTSGIYKHPTTERWLAIVWQNGDRVFEADGCESRQHAEQIATDIRVRYALVKRPTI